MAVGRFDGQLAAGGHGVAGVDGEVEQAVFHLIGIRPGAPQAAGQNRFHLDRLPDRALKQFLHAAHQRVEVQAGGRQRLTPREGQQALGQCRRPVARLDREPDMAHQIVVAGQLVVQYVEVAQDGLQQVVEVMGDAPGKLADGLHLLGLPQGFLRLLALRHLRPDAFLQSGVQQSKLILRRFLAVDIDGGAEPAGHFTGRCFALVRPHCGHGAGWRGRRTSDSRLHVRAAVIPHRRIGRAPALPPRPERHGRGRPGGWRPTTPTAGVIRCLASVIVPAVAEIAEGAIRVAEPDGGRRQIHQHAEAAFALFHLVFGTGMLDGGPGTVSDFADEDQFASDQSRGRLS